MQRMKRIFVLEFITCGGMHDREFPVSLMEDAELMYQSLLTDLRQIKNLEIITCRDKRLSAVPEARQNIDCKDDVWKIWDQYMKTSDMAWIIAPETNGLLLKLNSLAIKNACELIGSKIEAIQLTSSKSATNEYLAMNDIPTLLSRRADEGLLESNEGWVIKPDDGAGNEDCFYFQASQEFEQWREQECNLDKFIQQRYLAGSPFSLSVVYGNKSTELLACNKQITKIIKGKLVTERIIVNGFDGQYDELEKLAKVIGKVIPGLRGYVGIDLIMNRSEPVVLEINPRVTSSYAELSETLDFNVANMIINMLKVKKSGQYQVSKQVNFA